MSAQLVPIVRPVLLIGRHPECDIRIDSPQISRRHCCLAMAYDRVVIRDLGSRHGVRVNGVVIDEAKLNLGDEIAIGHLIYRLENLAPVTGKAPRPGQSRPNSPDPDEIIDLDDDLIPME